VWCFGISRTSSAQRVAEQVVTRECDRLVTGTDRTCWMAPKPVWVSRSTHRLSRSERVVVPNLSLFETKMFEKREEGDGKGRGWKLAMRPEREPPTGATGLPCTVHLQGPVPALACAAEIEYKHSIIGYTHTVLSPFGHYHGPRDCLRQAFRLCGIVLSLFLLMLNSWPCLLCWLNLYPSWERTVSWDSVP
jgi:hypothetical protein